MNESPQPQWISLHTPDGVEEKIHQALAMAEFNTCSGIGHRDKNQRYLTLVGFRTSKDQPRRNVLGVLSKTPEIQAMVVATLSDMYSARTGKPLHIWQPKPIFE